MTQPNVPMFSDSQGGGNWDGNITPWMRDLVGRLCFLEMVPGSYSTEDKIGDNVRPSVRANILVLDASQFGLTGGELVFGGKTGSASEPHTDRIGTPAFFKGVKVSNDSIVKALVEEDAKRTAGTSGGWKIGVPEEGKGTKGNNPLHLTSARVDYHGRQRPNADAMWSWAEQQFGAFLGGNLPLAGESTLIPPPPSASPEVHKRFQERVKARTEHSGVSAQPAVSVAPTYAPAVTAASQYAPGQPPQTAPVVSTATGAPVVHQQAVPSGQDDAVPPGWDPAAWNNLDGSVRTMIWAQVRSQQA